MALQSKPKMQHRPLTHAEQAVREWVLSKRGILSKIAEDLELSIAFVQRVAYDREAQSKRMRVEKKLVRLGCPLIQAERLGLTTRAT